LKGIPAFKFRLVAALAALGLAGAALAHGADGVRAEVAKPLLEAQKLALAGKHRQALAKLAEADRFGAKTEIDTYRIERLRASAAAAAGDNEAAIAAFESVLRSGRLPAGDVPGFTAGLAGLYYRAGNWPQAIIWIKRTLADADTAQMRELLIQAHYLSGDYAGAASLLRPQTSGPGPSESALQLLANIEFRQNDTAGYAATLEKLAANFPKPAYWADLLARVPGKPGFSSSLHLDVARLKLAHGLLDKPIDFMEMAQLALLAGNPAEAVHIVAQGYRSGALGAGPDAARHQRLKDLAARTLAEKKKNAAALEAQLVQGKNADALAAFGFSLVSEGALDKGLALMKQALAMGTLKHPEQARLHLGIAYANAGRKPDALSALATVRGADGAFDLARYWILQLKQAG
jgi:Tfp pilus assembly protein PilF